MASPNTSPRLYCLGLQGGLLIPQPLLWALCLPSAEKLTRHTCSRVFLPGHTLGPKPCTSGDWMSSGLPLPPSGVRPEALPPDRPADGPAQGACSAGPGGWALGPEPGPWSCSGKGFAMGPKWRAMTPDLGTVKDSQRSLGIRALHVKVRCLLPALHSEELGN